MTIDTLPSTPPPSTSTSRDRFKPEMPRIPGVNDVFTGDAARSAGEKRFGLLVLAAAVLACAGGLGWWIVRSTQARAFAIVSAGIEAAVKPSAPAPAAAVATTDASSAEPNQNSRIVGTIEELAQPWSAKKFTFVNPVTNQSVPAMIVRLPGTNKSTNQAYWAFSLNAPYEKCQLEYVTDLQELAARYDYRARHPMVLAACNGIIYDPLRMGTSPLGAWVRGDIVRGIGIRPPLAIDIRVQGRELIADRME
jgi:hypothetical protein